MQFLRETWDEMLARHDRERRAVLDGFIAQRATIAEAASVLGTSKSALEEAVYALGIVWPAQRACEANGWG